MEREMTEEEKNNKNKEKTMTHSTTGSASTPAHDWIMWQLVDSALPAGGFAHSQGLEAALHAGMVADGAALHRHCRITLQAAASLSVPFVYAATRHPTADDCLALSAALHPLLAVHVVRRASLSQGAGMLRVVVGAFAAACAPLLELERLTHSVPPGAPPHPPLHHCVVLGAACGCVGLTPAAACRVFLFTLLRDLIGAATRLNVVGPHQAAVLLAELSPLGEKALQTALAKLETSSSSSLHLDDDGDAAYVGGDGSRPSTRLALVAACATAPLQDTLQGGSDHLYSRLFSS